MDWNTYTYYCGYCTASVTSTANTIPVGWARVKQGAAVRMCCPTCAKALNVETEHSPLQEMLGRYYSAVLEKCREREEQKASAEKPPVGIKPPAQKRSCTNCRFMRMHLQGPECHFNPPVVVQGVRKGAWPLVDEYSWCAEWGRPEQGGES